MPDAADDNQPSEPEQDYPPEVLERAQRHKMILLIVMGAFLVAPGLLLLLFFLLGWGK